jgi:hypothetical protein
MKIVYRHKTTDECIIVDNSIYHVRSMHIEVHYHFVKEKVLVGGFDLIHDNTKI